MSDTGFVIWSELNNIGFGVQVDKKITRKLRTLQSKDLGDGMLLKSILSITT